MQNNNRSAFYAGFSLFFCFGLLYASNMIQRIFYGQPLLGALVATILAFGVPAFGLAYVLRKKGYLSGLRLGFPHFRLKKIIFSIETGITVSLLVVLLNAMLLNVSGSSEMDLTVSIVTADSLQQSFAMTLLGVAVAPALLEEIFLRGVLQPVYEKLVGTWSAILFTAVSFAMLHGSSDNFVGPVIAGCLYGYLTYEFQSIWPAFLAHLSNNLLYLIALWLTDTYASFGIWEYFSFLSVIILLLFLYFTFRMAEDLFENDEMPHFQRRRLPILKTILTMALNPGFLVFALAFMAKAVFGII